MSSLGMAAADAANKRSRLLAAFIAIRSILVGEDYRSSIPVIFCMIEKKVS